MHATVPLPTSEVDLFADDVLHDPYPALRELREAGPAVRLTAYYTKVLLSFASANRDERKWERPEEFLVRRNPVDHVALGYGVHGCAGQGLARLEAHAVLGALVPRVSSIELAGEPVRKLNNVIRGMASLPVTVRTERQ